MKLILVIFSGLNIEIKSMKKLNYGTWAYGGRKVQYFRFANSVEPGVNRRRLLDLNYYAHYQLRTEALPKIQRLIKVLTCA